jgi:hypothetical protein
MNNCNSKTIAVTDIIKLENYDDEDINDVILKLQKSFKVKFSKNAFANVKTFGDVCDVFENTITYENRDDCTKQQAFYRIRKAISLTQLIDESEIKLDNKLAELFLKHNRRQKAKEFQHRLEIRIKFLTYPGWLATIFETGMLLSFLIFFIDWKIALSGIACFSLAIKIAITLGKDLDLHTVRQLVEKVARENYSDIRRTAQTVNRSEIVATIIDSFNNDLNIEKKYLTRDASFNWS